MNKYNAKKTQIDRIWFDSKAESLRYLLLKDRQRKGEISQLCLQPMFWLIVDGVIVGTYTPDFGFTENLRAVVDDTKGGYRQEAFALRAKLFMALYPDIELRVNGVALKRPKPPEQARVAVNAGKKNRRSENVRAL